MSAYRWGASSWGAGDQYGAPAPITLTGLASTVAFGKVTPSLHGIAATTAFGTPTLVPAATHISPAGKASTLAFGTPTLVGGLAHFALTGRASTLAFGTPTIVAGATHISPTGIASSAALGVPTWKFTEHLTGIASSAALGTPAWKFALTPAGVASTLAFGATSAPRTEIGFVWGRSSWGARVWGGAPSVSEGIASTVQFGTPAVTHGPQTRTITGIASTVTFGAPPTEVAGAPTAGFIWGASSWGDGSHYQGATSPSLVRGIGSALTFGAVRIGQSIVPAGIASTLQFGPLVPPALQHPTGIASTLAFGTVDVGDGAPGQFGWDAFGAGTFGGTERGAVIWGASGWGDGDRRQGPDDHTIVLDGIAGGVAFGIAAVGAASIVIAAVPSTLTFGTLRFLTTGPQPAVSTLRFGAVTIRTIVAVALAGVPSGLQFGPATLAQFGFAAPLSLVSTVAFGDVTPTIPLTGIPSSVEIYDVTLLFLVVGPAAIAPTSTFGSITVTVAQLSIPAGIPSTLTFGATPGVLAAGQFSVTGIPSSETVGAPSFTAGNQLIIPGIGSTTTFGTLNELAAVTFTVLAIVSTVAFGDAMAPDLTAIVSTLQFGLVHVALVPRGTMHVGAPESRWLTGALVYRFEVGAATLVIIVPLDELLHVLRAVTRWSVGAAESRYDTSGPVTPRWTVGAPARRTSSDTPSPSTIAAAPQLRVHVDDLTPALV